MPSQWPGLSDPEHSRAYIERFRRMAAAGDDIVGEARLLDAMVGRHSRLLDAGCGPGRTAGWLAGQGHDVVGLDIDPLLIEAAEHDYPGPRYVVGDLTKLAASPLDPPFDAVLCAGNVLAFVDPGTEVAALQGIRRALRPEGFALIGFHVARYPLAEFDDHVTAAGLTLEQRWTTWQLTPWNDAADFAVSVVRPRL